MLEMDNSDFLEREMTRFGDRLVAGGSKFSRYSESLCSSEDEGVVVGLKEFLHSLFFT